MAEKLKGNKGSKVARKKKGDEEAPTKGHNLVELGKQIAGFFEGMDKLNNQQEESNGSFNLRKADVKEKTANLTGHSKKHLTKIYKKHRDTLKEEQARAESEPQENDDLDALMAAAESVKDTPLWRAAIERAGG